MKPDYQAMYTRLQEALKVSPDEQIRLLQTTDEAYAFLETEGEALSDEEYLAIKMMLGEAETRLARYFGM